MNLFVQKLSSDILSKAKSNKSKNFFLVFFRKIPEPTIFEKMKSVLSETMTRNNLKNSIENFDKIGFLEKGDSYGVWTLLNNKVMVRALSGVAVTETRISYFKRNHFFEAMEMGLTSKKPEILNILWNLPVFSKMPRFQILGNISKLKLVKLKYGEVVAREGEDAEFVYILKKGKINVKLS